MLGREKGSLEWVWEIYDSLKASDAGGRTTTVGSWTNAVVVVRESLALVTGTWGGGVKGCAVEG